MRLTIRKCDDIGDWYVIERAEHDGRKWTERTSPSSSALRCSARFSDADVEGTGDEMRAIATAIRARRGERFKRCAIRIDGDRAFFCSPRNSREDGECTLAEADELAALIEEQVAP